MGRFRADYRHIIKPPFCWVRELDFFDAFFVLVSNTRLYMYASLLIHSFSVVPSPTEEIHLYMLYQVGPHSDLNRILVIHVQETHRRIIDINHDRSLRKYLRSDSP